MKKVFLAVFVVFALAIFIGTLTQPTSHIEDITPCMTWALGDDWLFVKTRDIPARWNERHGDLFKLHIDDDLRKGNMRMYEAWRRRERKNDD